ncbi:MAG: 2-C-methyl-D-erythritol 4-phosphate cytidylyltransferase [Acidimicrobiales bacterium]
MIAWAVVVAGGSGSRFGRLKQLEVLNGRRILDRSVDAMDAVCGGVVVVVPTVLVPSIGRELDEARVVAGGSTRSASVRAGLAAVGDDATHVLVHDAARPLATRSLVDRVVGALASGARAVVPVVPVTDSLRMADGSGPLDRSTVVAVQTPQGFAVDVLRAAHRGGDEASDDATLVGALGVDIVHVPGESTNIKITEPHDLAVADLLLAEPPGPGSATASSGAHRVE